MMRTLYFLLFIVRKDCSKGLSSIYFNGVERNFTELRLNKNNITSVLPAVKFLIDKHINKLDLNCTFALFQVE